AGEHRLAPLRHAGGLCEVFKQRKGLVAHFAFGIVEEKIVERQRIAREAPGIGGEGGAQVEIPVLGAMPPQRFQRFLIGAHVVPPVCYRAQNLKDRRWPRKGRRVNCRDTDERKGTLPWLNSLVQ